MAKPNARLVAASKARERAAKAARTVASLTDATFATACPYVGFLSTRPCRKRVNCQIPRPTNPFPARPRIGMLTPPFSSWSSPAHTPKPPHAGSAHGGGLCRSSTAFPAKVLRYASSFTKCTRVKLVKSVGFGSEGSGPPFCPEPCQPCQPPRGSRLSGQRGRKPIRTSRSRPHGRPCRCAFRWRQCRS